MDNKKVFRRKLPSKKHVKKVLSGINKFTSLIINIWKTMMKTSENFKGNEDRKPLANMIIVKFEINDFMTNRIGIHFEINDSMTNRVR